MKLLLLLFVALTISVSAQEPFVKVYDIAPTGSMRPTLSERNQVHVRHMPFKDIVAGPDGDIIIVRLPQPVRVGNIAYETVCHRVVRKSSDGSILVTRGDNCDRDDPRLVDESMYMGTVVMVTWKE